MLPPNLFKLKCLRSLKIAGNPKLQTEIGLSDEIVSMGTKAIIKYLRPSDTITKSTLLFLVLYFVSCFLLFFLCFSLLMIFFVIFVP